MIPILLGVLSQQSELIYIKHLEKYLAYKKHYMNFNSNSLNVLFNFSLYFIDIPLHQDYINLILRGNFLIIFFENKADVQLTFHFSSHLLESSPLCLLHIDNPDWPLSWASDGQSIQPNAMLTQRPGVISTVATPLYWGICSKILNR